MIHRGRTFCGGVRIEAEIAEPDCRVAALDRGCGQPHPQSQGNPAIKFELICLLALVEQAERVPGRIGIHPTTV